MNFLRVWFGLLILISPCISNFFQSLIFCCFLHVSNYNYFFLFIAHKLRMNYMYSLAQWYDFDVQTELVLKLLPTMKSLIIQFILHSCPSYQSVSKPFNWFIICPFITQVCLWLSEISLNTSVVSVCVLFGDQTHYWSHPSVSPDSNFY